MKKIKLFSNLTFALITTLFLLVNSLKTNAQSCTIVNGNVFGPTANWFGIYDGFGETFVPNCNGNISSIELLIVQSDYPNELGLTTRHFIVNVYKGTSPSSGGTFLGGTTIGIPYGYNSATYPYRIADFRSVYGLGIPVTSGEHYYFTVLPLHPNTTNSSLIVYGSNSDTYPEGGMISSGMDASGNHIWNGTGADLLFNMNITADLPPITGDTAICVGSSITLSNAAVGGNWSHSGRVSITTNSSGDAIVTAINGGSTTITYTLGTKHVTKRITLNVLPAVPSIAYAPGTRSPQTTSVGGVISLCTNRNFTIVGTPTNGVWTKTGPWTLTPTGAPSTTALVNTGTTLGAVTVKYEITNIYGCKNSRTIPANIVLCAAKGALNNNDITCKNLQYSLYPNPAKNILNINVENLINSGSISVVDLFGKQILQQSISLGVNKIDISSLNKGLYIVSIAANNTIETKKIIIE